MLQKRIRTILQTCALTAAMAIPAYAQVTYVGRTQNTAGSSGSNVTASLPSGAAVGDTFVIAIASYGSAPTTPSGVTALGHTNDPSPDYIYYYDGTYTSGGPTSFTFGNAGYPKVILRDYRGVGSVIAGSSASGSSKSTSLSLPSLSGGNMYVGMWFNDISGDSITCPSNLGNGSADVTQWPSCDGDDATNPGLETAGAATNAWWIGADFMLTAASGGGTPTPTATPTPGGGGSTPSPLGAGSYVMSQGGYAVSGVLDGAYRPTAQAIGGANQTLNFKAYSGGGLFNILMPSTTPNGYSADLQQNGVGDVTLGYDVLTVTPVAGGYTVQDGGSGLYMGPVPATIGAEIPWSSSSSTWTIAAPGSGTPTPTATPTGTATPTPTASPTPSGGSIAYIGRSENNNENPNVNVAVNLPSGVQNGDFLVAFVNAYNSVPAAPNGSWTRIQLCNNQNPDYLAEFTSQYVTGGPTSVTWGSLNYPSAVIRAYRGANSVEASACAPAVSGTNTTGSTFSVPGLPATQANGDMYVAEFYNDLNTAVITGPSDLGDAGSATGGAAGWANWDGDVYIPTTGTTLPTQTASH